MLIRLGKEFPGQRLVSLLRSFLHKPSLSVIGTCVTITFVCPRQQGMSVHSASESPSSDVNVYICLACVVPLMVAACQPRDTSPVVLVEARVNISPSSDWSCIEYFHTKEMRQACQLRPHCSLFTRHFCQLFSCNHSASIQCRVNSVKNSMHLY